LILSEENERKLSIGRVDVCGYHRELSIRVIIAIVRPVVRAVRTVIRRTVVGAAICCITGRVVRRTVSTVAGTVGIVGGRTIIIAGTVGTAVIRVCRTIAGRTVTAVICAIVGRTAAVIVDAIRAVGAVGTVAVCSCAAIAAIAVVVCSCAAGCIAVVAVRSITRELVKWPLSLKLCRSQRDKLLTIGSPDGNPTILEGIGCRIAILVNTINTQAADKNISINTIIVETTADTGTFSSCFRGTALCRTNRSRQYKQSDQ